MTPYKKLINAIDSLIVDKAHRSYDGWSLSFDDLYEHDQGHLTALMIEYNNLDTSDCFRQNVFEKDDEITIALLKMLTENTYDSQEELISAIRTQSIKRHRSQIQEHINDRCGWCQQELDSEYQYAE